MAGGQRWGLQSPSGVWAILECHPQELQRLALPPGCRGPREAHGKPCLSSPWMALTIWGSECTWAGPGVPVVLYRQAGGKGSCRHHPHHILPGLPHLRRHWDPSYWISLSLRASAGLRPQFYTPLPGCIPVCDALNPETKLAGPQGLVHSHSRGNTTRPPCQRLGGADSALPPRPLPGSKARWALTPCEARSFKMQNNSREQPPLTHARVHV